MKRKILRIICFPFRALGYGVIYFYKFMISPFLIKSCRFYPTCSTYAIHAISRFGLIRGSILAFKRIIRCNPKSVGGIDFVPFNIKGEEKWLL